MGESGGEVVVGMGGRALTEKNNQDQCARVQSRASTSWLHLPDAVAQATNSADLQLLKHNLRDLQVRVHELERFAQNTKLSDTVDTCYIYVRPYRMSLDAVSNDSLACFGAALCWGSPASRDILSLHLK